MNMMTVKIEIKRGNPNVGYSFEKDGETITWESMSLDEKQKVVNAFAGGYGLFAGHIDVEQEASEVQLR